MPGLSIPAISLTKKNADLRRRFLCAEFYGDYGFTTQKVFDACNRLFNRPTYALDFTGKDTVSAKNKDQSATGNPQSDAHESCLNAKDYEGVPAQIKRWNKAGGKVLQGLIRRREAESLLFEGKEWHHKTRWSSL